MRSMTCGREIFQRQKFGPHTNQHTSQLRRRPNVIPHQFAAIFEVVCSPRLGRLRCQSRMNNRTSSMVLDRGSRPARRSATNFALFTARKPNVVWAMRCLARNSSTSPRNALRRGSWVLMRDIILGNSPLVKGEFPTHLCSAAPLETLLVGMGML